MSLSDLNFDIGFQEIVEPGWSLSGMRRVIVMGDTMYRDIYISGGDINLMLGIRTI